MSTRIATIIVTCVRDIIAPTTRLGGITCFVRLFWWHERKIRGKKNGDTTTKTNGLHGGCNRPTDNDVRNRLTGSSSGTRSFDAPRDSAIYATGSRVQVFFFMLHALVFILIVYPSKFCTLQYRTRYTTTCRRVRRHHKNGHKNGLLRFIRFLNSAGAEHSLYARNWT